MNQLDQLKQHTRVVADSSHFKALAAFAPRDATTNASLVLEAVLQPGYAALLAQAVAAKKRRPAERIADEVLVRFGLEILKAVPGRVSTAIDARLSFDTAASIARAHQLIELYERAGVGRERLLIQLAATWEGIQAAKALEHEGIHCNLTLLFAFCQAVACGEAGVTLISPAVERVCDWHRRAAGSGWNEAAMSGANDPGVQSVARIYSYFKHYGIATEVMGVGLQNVGQIQALSGCDLLSLSPELMAQLQALDAALPRALDPEAAKRATLHAVTFNEPAFRYALNDDAMASDQLAEGIRALAADAARLDTLIDGLKG